MAVSKTDSSGHCWSNAQEAGQRTSKMAFLPGKCCETQQDAGRDFSDAAGASKLMTSHQRRSSSCWECTTD